MTRNQGRNTEKKKKKNPNCSQIQIKNLESPNTALTIGGKIEGALCHIAIASHLSPFCVLQQM